MEETEFKEILEDYKNLTGQSPLEKREPHGLCLLGLSVFKAPKGLSVNFLYKSRLEGRTIGVISDEMDPIRGKKCRMNHRYPNRLYTTVSQKANAGSEGNRSSYISRYGLYICLPLSQFKSIDCFEFAIDGRCYVFPVSFRLTEEHSYAAIGGVFVPATKHFSFELSSRHQESGQASPFFYSTDADLVEKYAEYGKLLTGWHQDFSFWYEVPIIIHGGEESTLRPMPILPINFKKGQEKNS